MKYDCILFPFSPTILMESGLLIENNGNPNMINIGIKKCYAIINDPLECLTKLRFKYSWSLKLTFHLDCIL